MSDAEAEQLARPKSDWGVTLGFGLLTFIVTSVIMSGVKPLLKPMMEDSDSLRNWIGIASWLFVFGAAGWVMLWRRRVKRKWLLIVFLLLWAGTYNTIERAVMLRHRPVQFVAPDGSQLPMEQELALGYQCGVFSPTSGPGWREEFMTLHVTDPMQYVLMPPAFTTLAALLPTLALGFTLRLRDRRKLSKETL